MNGRDIPRTYICHPYSFGVEENVSTVTTMARAILSRGDAPVAPHLYLPQFLTEATERREAVWMCKRLMDAATVMYVSRVRLTPGMEEDLEYAASIGLPIRFVNPEDFRV